MGMRRWAVMGIQVVMGVAASVTLACSDDSGGGGGSLDGGTGGSTGGGAGNYRGSCDAPSVLCQDHYGWADSAMTSIQNSCENAFKGTWSTNKCSGTYCGTCTVGDPSSGYTEAHYVSDCDASIKEGCEQGGYGTWTDP